MWEGQGRRQSQCPLVTKVAPEEAPEAWPVWAPGRAESPLPRATTSKQGRAQHTWRRGACRLSISATSPEASGWTGEQDRGGTRGPCTRSDCAPGGWKCG